MRFTLVLESVWYNLKSMHIFQLIFEALLVHRLTIQFQLSVLAAKVQICWYYFNLCLFRSIFFLAFWLPALWFETDISKAENTFNIHAAFLQTFYSVDMLPNNNKNISRKNTPMNLCESILFLVRNCKRLSASSLMLSFNMFHC